MAVNNHGIEAIRKAANQIILGDDREYYLAVKLIDAITGSFSPSGLNKELKITTEQISTTAVKIPTSALADRNSISIHNLSETDYLFIGPNSSVTADRVLGNTSGWEVPPNHFFNIDIKNGIELWAISTATIKVKIMEVA